MSRRGGAAEPSPATSGVRFRRGEGTRIFFFSAHPPLKWVATINGLSGTTRPSQFLELNPLKSALIRGRKLVCHPTCQTVSSTVPSTHLTTATGRSPNFGRAGLPPQMRSTSALMSCSGRIGKLESFTASSKS